jgi:CDP-paratose 2-epimerase
MKLLVTGGCGFLGSNLAADAIDREDDLMIFDSLQRNGSRDNLAWLQSLGTLKFEHGDIRNENDVTRAIKKFRPDAVFHLAGQVAMTTSICNPRMDFEVNALGTLNLLEAVREHAPNAIIIYSSTNKVYGDLGQYTYCETDTRYLCKEYPMGFDESISLAFQSPYGCSKGAADQYMLDYARLFGLRTIVFRHSSMYGGRQFPTSDQGWVGWFCQKALELRSGRSKEPIEVSGNGKQVRDVLHGDDLKVLYREALNVPDTEYGKAYNIGGGVENSLSILELFSQLEELLDVSIKHVGRPPRDSDQRVFIADITKAIADFSWAPRVKKEEGLLNVIKWLEH